MNTKRIITFVLLLTVTLLLAGCSGTMAVNPNRPLIGHENSSHSAMTQTPAKTPWWVNGGINPNWPY